MAQRPRGTAHQRLEARGKRAQQAAQTHLGAKQAQLGRAGVGQLEVVHAHDAHAARVHDLLVKQVARDEHLGRLQVGEAQVGGGYLKLHLVLVEAGHVLAPADHEGRLTRAHERQRRDAREHLSGGDAQVGHRAEALSVRIVDRVTQKLGKVDHACSFAYAPHGAPSEGGTEGSSTVRSRFHQ